MRVEIAMMRTPDGHSRIELSRSRQQLSQISVMPKKTLLVNTGYIYCGEFRRHSGQALLSRCEACVRSCSVRIYILALIQTRP